MLCCNSLLSTNSVIEISVITYSNLYGINSIITQVLHMFVATNGSGCVTDDNNKPCVFPFKYQGKEQNSCIESNKKFWCATEVKSNGYYKKWAYCGENCPRKCAKYIFSKHRLGILSDCIAKVIFQTRGCRRCLL